MRPQSDNQKPQTRKAKEKKHKTQWSKKKLSHQAAERSSLAREKGPCDRDPAGFGPRGAQEYTGWALSLNSLHTYPGGANLIRENEVAQQQCLAHRRSDGS